MSNNEIYIVTPNPQYNSQGQFTGDSGFMIMSSSELESLISKQLFPVGAVPTGVIEFLKVKHAVLIKNIRDYVLTKLPRSKENPIQISELRDAIKMALVEFNIDINILRSFDEAEVHEWKVAKANGELGPFGSIKRK